MSFKRTAKQEAAVRLIASEAQHCMLFGGSRSGKTFLLVWCVVVRALAAAKSRHAILRFRFNACKASIVLDTFPKVMELCFPSVTYHVDKSDWYAQLPNGSQIWFGGLDDKERTEKILGQEHATIYLNECSQIPWSSVTLAVTRLAQVCTYTAGGVVQTLRRKMLFDCNPPSQAHWTYLLFVKKVDPESKRPLPDADDYASLQINPRDNIDNLDERYIKSLEGLSARMRARFLDGKFGDITANALWNLEMLDRWRYTGAGELPDMQRIIVAVDPSGAGDEDNLENDEIGIIVAGLGIDGNGYVLEDLTCKIGPSGWGKVATNAFERHSADKIVAETNFGGEMVRFVVQAAKPGVPFKKLTASRGKVVRAEPIAALTEQGKVRLAGDFPALEDEMCAFTTNGYLGANSPNRVDAMVWAMSELFPGMAAKEKKEPQKPTYRAPSAHGWMR